jgi:tRNA 2-thiouridine synthesizing protein E
MQHKLNDSSINTDTEGFLLDQHQWNQTVAEILARNDNVRLTEDHWTIINILRDFYERYAMAPAQRILIKKAAECWGKEKANSIYLHHLFPEGPIKQASKIAGLPKPLKCM